MSLEVIICCQVHLCAEGVWSLLENSPDIKVLGIAHNDEEIENLLKYSPDVIVTDLDCCSIVLEKTGQVEGEKVLLINDTRGLNSESIKLMITDGLGGILPPEADSTLLKKAIQKLYEGELWLDRHTMRDVLSRKESKKRDINLTKKEKEILNFVCAGMTNKEIANKLFISEQTVKSHCNHLFKKFGVSSRLKLAVNAPKYFPDSLRSLQ